MASHRRVFWSLVLPIAIATYLIVDRCVTSLGRGISDEGIRELIIAEFAPNCIPEPAEQLAFILALVLPVGFAFLITILLKVTGVFRRPEPSNPWIRLLSTFSQLCLIGFGVKAIVYQVTIVQSYRFLDSPALLEAAIVMGLLLAYQSVRPRATPQFQAAWGIVRRQIWLPWMMAMLWVVTFAITGVYRQGELPFTTNVVQFHIPYTMGEFAAVVNGRVPLVDFYSQYLNLQTFVALPIFRRIGFNVGTFTAVMFCFSTTALALTFATLSKIFKSAWSALVLFVPLVAFAFYSEDVTINGYSNNAFNYYAVGPFRYFGDCVLAWLAVWYLERPTTSRLLVVAPISSLVALNNLDFGIPAAAGMLACVLLYPPQFARAGLVKRIFGAATFYSVILLATLGVYCLAIRVAFGTWPMLDQLMVFQKTFALLGYFMLPMPQMGLHWVIYLTSISAVVIAIYETYSSVHSEIADNRRVVNGSLAFAGIASFGPLAYYVGRSHPSVLEALFLAWAFVMVQLLHRAWQHWREAAKLMPQSSDTLLPIPIVAIAGLCCLMLPMVLEAPSPTTQAFRLSSNLSSVVPGEETSNAPFIRIIQRYVRAGSRTVIAYPNGHWLALQAGVANGYPFAHVGSVILNDQVNAIMAALARLPVKEQYLFGTPMAELRVRLEEHGFRQLDAIGGFAVWSRRAE